MTEGALHPTVAKVTERIIQRSRQEPCGEDPQRSIALDQGQDGDPDGDDHQRLRSPQPEIRYPGSRYRPPAEDAEQEESHSGQDERPHAALHSHRA